MVDQAEQLDRARRLAASRKVERSVQELVTALAFGPEGNADPYAAGADSMLVDVGAVLKRSGGDDKREAEIRLRAAGQLEHLERAVANTTTTDVPGVIGLQPLPGWVVGQVAQRQADNVALIDALAGPELVRGGRPWIPTPAPPEVGGPQTGGEKTQLPSSTIGVAGASQMPTLIGFTANVSEQVMRSAGDAILLLVGEAATVGLANYVVGHLSTASTAAADVHAALVALEAAGWAPDLVVGSRSAIAKAIPGATPAGYPGIVYGPTGGDLYVIARAGVWFQHDAQTEWLLAEPAIGGREVAAITSAVFAAGTGAVQKVTP